MIEQSSKSDSLLVSHSEDHADATKDTINSLVQKVASLERELAFQKLYNELYKLNTDMSMFKNTLNNTSNSLQINLYGRNLDFDLYKAYKEDLEVSKGRIIIFQ